ncbi:MAG: ABC transporter ATP-binding protein [Nitrospinae bacterium]|nr:ABC transporter ATP-binding protein [Nitrospinota bacterium]
MASITLQNLVKKFGETVTAVAGVDLDVSDGEFMVVVGPSGCGKTTTLNMISGFEEPTSGTMFIGDRIVNHLEPGDRGLGMVFQDLALFPHMTVFENIAFGLRVDKTADAEVKDRVSKVATTMKISHLLSKKPAQCSGGEAQRVALARTIITEPQVLLMDEPLSSLDAKLRIEMRTELKRLHEELKSTFVYVTHDQAEAMTMADRIMVMDRGYVQQIDTPLGIYRKPTNQFVGTFFGQPTMNIIPGRIESNGSPKFISEHFEMTFVPDVIPGSAMGKAINIGVRSENVSIGDEGAAADVRLIEPLGDETLVFFSCGDEEFLVAKVDAEREFSPGDNIRFGFQPGGMHFFDAESGARLE